MRVLGSANVSHIPGQQQLAMQLQYVKSYQYRSQMYLKPDRIFIAFGIRPFNRLMHGVRKNYNTIHLISTSYVLHIILNLSLKILTKLLYWINCVWNRNPFKLCMLPNKCIYTLKTTLTVHSTVCRIIYGQVSVLARRDQDIGPHSWDWGRNATVSLFH